MSNVAVTSWGKIHLLAAARALSLLGTELTMFSLVFREKDHGSLAVAAIFMAGALPGLLLSPITGVIADRFSTRQIVPIAAITSAVAVAAQIFEPDTWLSIVLLFASTAFSSVLPLTWGKVVRSLSREADYSRSNGLVQTYFAAAMTSGPFLAGWLVTTTGFTFTFIIDTLLTSLLAVVPFAFNLNLHPEISSAAKIKPSQGFTTVWQSPLLRSLTFLAFAIVVCINIVSVGDVFLLTEKLGADAFIYGVVGGVFAVGMLGGSVVASSLKLSNRAEIRLLGFGLFGVGAAGVAVGLAPNYWVVMAVWFIAGMCNSAINAYGVGLLTKSISMDVQGRAFAAFNGITSAGGMLSQGIAGFLLLFIDVRILFVSAGSLATLSVLLMFPSVVKASRMTLSNN